MIFEARGIETLYRAHFRACFNKKFTQTKARQRHKVTRLHLRSHINTPTFLPSKQLKTRAQENSSFTNFLLKFFINFSFFFRLSPLRTLRLYGGMFDDYFTIHLLPVATIFYDGRRVRRSASISEFYRIEFPKVITSHSSSFLLTANLLTTTSLA